MDAESDSHGYHISYVHNTCLSVESLGVENNCVPTHDITKVMSLNTQHTNVLFITSFNS